MSPEDMALCKQAIDLAQNGEKQEAYEQFCTLYNHGNAEDVTPLYWIAFTTPSQQEAERVVGAISHLAPEHPSLPDVQTYIERKWPRPQQTPTPVEPAPRQVLVMECPYCHMKAPPLIRSKVSTGGWVTFVVILILFFPLCWIGLLIRESYYVCSRCGIQLGPAPF
jgi:hypothetical protein